MAWGLAGAGGFRVGLAVAAGRTPVGGANVARRFVRSQVLADYPDDAAGVLIAGYHEVPGGTALRAVSMDALTAEGGCPASGGDARAAC